MNTLQECRRNHRKSRYESLKKSIDSKYEKTFTEIDTKNVNKSSIELNYIDLFSGCGGLSLGIKQAGFTKLCDVEILQHAYETLKINFPESHHYNGDIAEFDPKNYIDGKAVHLVVGGPPCQGFSVAGKRNVKDERNNLFNQFLRIVKELNPYFFVLENVPGILTLGGGDFHNKIVKVFEDIGYSVSVRILESANYGVPQLRTRAVFIGNRLNLKNPYPKIQYTTDEYKTIDSAISDLEAIPRNKEINHEWTEHSKSFIERIKKVKQGCSLYDTFADSYKRQRIGEPSMAIKENHGGTHIHYKLDRCISAREMARLQSFPDTFKFWGTHKQTFIQIGNAVPPLLAKNIGIAIRLSLENERIS